MRRLFRLFALASVVVSVVGGVRSENSAAEALPLPESLFPDLKSILEKAIRQSPRMVARNTEEVVAEAKRIESRAGQLPTVGGYASYYPWTRDIRRDVPEPLTSQKTSYSFSVVQPVFHWGALRDNSRIGELQLKVAQGQTAEVYRLLVGEIRGLFLQLIAKKVALAGTHRALALSETQLAEAKARLGAKAIAPDDLFGPTIGLEQARLATDRADEDYANARRLLGKLCGLPPIADEQVPVEIPPVNASAAAVENVAKEFTAQPEPDTFGLRNLRSEIAVERLTYDIARARLRPKLNLVAGASQDQQSYTANIGARYGVQEFFTGAVVSWSIFDGFATRSQKIGSLARRRQLERNYREATADLITAVQSQQRQAEFSARSLALVEKNLAHLADALRRQKDDLARGLISPVDFDAAQSGYFNYQLAAYGARADYLMKIADLLSMTLKDPALANLPASLR